MEPLKERVQLKKGVTEGESADIKRYAQRNVIDEQLQCHMMEEQDKMTKGKSYH
jgi:hypothetical protein